MKLVPNMFLLNVSDIDRAKEFYESLFELEIAFSAPGFAAYPIAPEVLLALQADWKSPPDGFSPNAELVMNVTATNEEIDALFAKWIGKGAREVDAPHMLPFGYTFVVADPDGNLIRVAPNDE